MNEENEEIEKRKDEILELLDEGQIEKAYYRTLDMELAYPETVGWIKITFTPHKS